MAISYVGGTTAVSAGNTDVSADLTALTGGSDSAPIDGDLVIFAFNIADADNVDLNLVMVTAGYTEVADLFGNGTQDANLATFYKYMTSTPDTTAVGEGSTGGTDTAIQAAVMVFRGVRNAADGGPFRVASTTATGTTVGDPDPPSISGRVVGDWAVIVGADAHTANVNGTFTGPTNYTTDFLTVGNQDTTDGIIGMGYRTDPANPENPGAMLTGTTATGWCAVTMILAEAPAAAELDQAHFRGRNDDGNETTATWKAAEDTDWSQDVDTNLRVRFTLDETAGVAVPSQNYQLQYNLNGAGWNNVDAASSVVRSSASPNLADATVTTNQLTAPTGTFEGGEFDEGNGLAGTGAIGAGNFTEFEFCVQIRSADVVGNDTVELRLVISGGAVLDTYAQTPSILVAANLVIQDALHGHTADNLYIGPTAHYAEGFEHQTLSGLQFGAASTGLFDGITVAGSSILASGGRNGGACLQISPSNAVCRVFKLIPGADPAVAVASFYIKFTAFPTNAALVGGIGIAGGAQGRLFYNTATGKLNISWDGAAPNSDVGPVLDLNRWYLVDLRADVTTNPRKLDCQVDGSATVHIESATAGSTCDAYVFGNDTGSETYTAQYDDLVTSNNGTNFPMGPHHTVHAIPTGDGTHNAGTNVMERDDGVDIGVETAWERLDQVPPTSSLYVQQAAVGAGNYAEITFPDTAETSIWGVIAVAALWSGGTTLNNGTTRIVDGSGATVVDVFSGDMSETAGLHFKTVVVPPPAGGWTPALFNALKARIGFSTNVDSIPRWSGISLQYVADGPGADLTIHKARHGHTADNVVLETTAATDLVIQDALHDHAADELALTQLHVLAIDDALHAHAADNVVLEVDAVDLVIQEALHGHAAENLDLTQVHELVIQDALHAHLADALQKNPGRADTFTRSGAGWGTADLGGAWVEESAATGAVETTTGTVAQIVHSSPGDSATSQNMRLEGDLENVEALVRIRVDKIPTGANISANMPIRKQAGLNELYRPTLEFRTDGHIYLVFSVAAPGSSFGPTLDLGAYTPNDWYWIKAQVRSDPNGGNFLFSKAWRDGDTEPASWQITENDDNATYSHGPGTIGLRSFTPTTCTNFPYTFQFDDLDVKVNQELSQVHVLQVAEALHAHVADNVVLTTADILEIQDALHGHSADNLVLVQDHVLQIQDALHGHSADNVVLSVDGGAPAEEPGYYSLRRRRGVVGSRR